jgi:hypothetical protein
LLPASWHPRRGRNQRRFCGAFSWIAISGFFTGAIKSCHDRSKSTTRSDASAAVTREGFFARGERAQSLDSWDGRALMERSGLAYAHMQKDGRSLLYGHEWGARIARACPDCTEPSG